MTAAGDPARGGLLRDAALLAGRGLRPALTAPRSTFTMVVYPLLFFVGFYAVFRRLLEARGVDYEQFLPAGVAVQSVLLVALATAFFLATDRRTGMSARLRSLPISRAAPLAARLALDAVRALVAVVVVLAVAAVAGFRLERGPLAGLGLLALAVAFAVVLALGTAAVGLAARDPEVVVSTLTLPYVLSITLSTAFVPVESFPGWLQPVVRLSPVSAVVDALRALSTDGLPLGDVLPALLWIAVLGLLLGGLAARATRRTT